MQTSATEETIAFILTPAEARAILAQLERGILHRNDEPLSVAKFSRELDKFLNGDE